MPTLGGLVRSNARRTPDRDALVAGDVRWSWSTFDARVDAVAAVLAGRGVGHGDRVALLLPNGAAFFVAFFAILRLGAIVVPVSTRSAAPELAHVLGDSGARLLLFDPSLDDLVRTFEGRFPDAPTDLVATHGCAGRPDLEALAADAPPLHPEPVVVEGDDAILMYTSGTTGLPKGVLLDHHRALWAATSEVASLGLRDGDRYLHLSPLHHSGGVVFVVVTTMIAGTHVVLPAFDPAATLEAIEAERCTFLLGVPTMFEFLLREPSFATRDLRSWRIGIFGAAPMPRATLSRMLDALPDVQLVQLCGQTEGGPGGIYSTAEQVRDRPEVTGHQAMVFYESRVVAEDGDDVAPGEVGEIVLRGAGVMKGYWGLPDATASTLRDGWLHTGDLARLDPDGCMTIVDRAKDLIITGGRNVYSLEVERVVASLPAVAEVAVVGRPHPEYGETIVAVVVPAPGAALDLAVLRTHCASEIADYKVPRDLVIVDALPRNAAGKVLKRELRTGASSSAGGAVR